METMPEQKDINKSAKGRFPLYINYLPFIVGNNLEYKPKYESTNI